jgi:thiosulfate reductase/polysulfide reductase chain A
LNRREFVKIAGKLSGALGLTGAAAPLLSGCESAVSGAESSDAPVRVTPTVCNICFWNCAGWVHQREGKPWKVVGHPNDLHSQGRLCTRGTGGIGAYLDPDRLKRPLMRVNGRTGQSFKEVSWDEALGFIAERMKTIAEAHGPDRIALFSHGDGAVYFKHLLRAFGSASFLLHPPSPSAAAPARWPSSLPSARVWAHPSAPTWPIPAASC